MQRIVCLVHSIEQMTASRVINEKTNTDPKESLENLNKAFGACFGARVGHNWTQG